MWIFNKDYNKWVITEDQLTKSNFDYLKQELVSTRYYSKCLSGATYLPINTVDNIYDILGEYEPRNWYIDSSGSQYSYTTIPQNASPINGISSNDYYTKYLSEYGLTLKNLFTPDRLIKDSINYLYVDVATTEQINLSTRYTNLIIDGVKLLSGHRLLVKDQISIETLPFDTNPNTYFSGNYTLVQDYGTTIEYNYYNSENGIYLFNNGYLTKTDDLSLYEDCIRYSVSVKLGTINTQRQFHLSRLLSGYYPTSSLNEPVEFIEKHNWLLRNKVDYNNLFEINYYDVLKHDPQTYKINSITYSIPERTIAVGEFGVILNTQQFTGLTGTSNIIPNKYKVNLRSITQTEKYYWICGDDGTLLKVRKHDFLLEKVNINIIKNLKSISFFNNLKGVVVGDLNTILITNDGGLNWHSIIVDDFESYYYNKVLFLSQDKIYIVGNTGVFIELEEDISGWSAYKRRISKFIDDYEEYLLVDNINDIIYTNISWPLTYNYPLGNTQSIVDNKELLLLVTNDGKIIANDLNSTTKFDFLYLEFINKYDNITNIIQVGTSSNFYFSGDNGILLFDITDFKTIGDNLYSNRIVSSNTDNNKDATLITELTINKLFDYNSNELLVCGNASLLKSGTHSIPLNLSLLDPNFESRLKSKMLFVDYDVASKLNFFTDAGDYRLPSSTSINLISEVDDITYSNNNTFTINPNFSGSIISTINVDSTSSNPQEIEVKLRLSNPAGITNLLVNLRSPNGNVINLKRVSSGTGTLLSNVTFTTSTNYNYFRNSLAPYTNKTYQMDKILPILSKTTSLLDNEPVLLDNFGFIASTNDLLGLLDDGSFFGNWNLYIEWTASSNVFFKPILPIDKPLGTLSGWDLTFVYTRPDEIDLNCLSFTPLVYGPTAPSFMTQSETNWLTYWKDRQKTFEYYSDMPLDESSKIEISTNFCKNSVSSVKDIFDITNELSEISKLAPTLLDTKQSRFNGLGLTPISAPNTLYDIYFYDYMMIVRVNDNFPVEVGDVLQLNSSVVDSQFVVNRIERKRNVTHLQPILKTKNSYSRYLYMYMDFNDNIITELMRSQNSITITNLNKFQNFNQLQERFNIHPISHGYELTYNVTDIKIDSKFNNITSYYNLATQVIFDGIDINGDFISFNKEMIYIDGFLKFGYTPTYNILDYLEGLNDTTNLSVAKFTADKEYYVMPHYKGLPSQGSGNSNSTNVYFKYTGITFSGTNIKPSNILKFGSDLKLEWQSIFIDTFVDIIMYSDNDYYNPDTNKVFTTERALVTKKYYNSIDDTYDIEFGKSIIFPIGSEPTFIDILSRRTLLQISEDLQELNNIHRPKFNNRIIDNSDITSHDYNNNFYNYDRTTNYKISTDSYTKILLSDVDTVKELSAIIYTDYKNEFSMNITRLAREYNIKITDTDSYNNKLLIICGEKHELKNSDGVILEFNGGTYSSEVLNQQYFGYHIVNVVDEYKVWIDIDYVNNTIVNDIGYLKYIKNDPFFNYQPIDIIDVGVNKKGKIAIELSIDNLKLTNDVYSLINIDYNKYRFRLIDGLNIETLSLKYPWILEAEVSGALLGLDTNGLVWYKGYWECGRWFGGTWISGTWKSGDWYKGTWNSKRITDNLISVEVDNSVSDTIQSTWFGGRWYDGTWNNGTWVDGRWYGGTWNNGDWYKGIWNDGTWNTGIMSGGVWVTGTWNGGIFNCDNDPAYWIDGKWNGGDFENGIWYNGIFEEKNSLARFGTKAYNSRTANWRAGKWLSGSFYSRMVTDNSGLPMVSTSHKYSIWKTGTWFTGDWYGGIAYHMDFQSGNWYGGILEEIQVIGISINYITLNGTFNFNIGDEINILNTLNINNSDIAYKYKVVYTDVDTINKKTKIYIDINTNSLITTTDTDHETGFRVVSRFRSANWKSGIWTNGIYETGLWEGGIWYNGIFKDGANWM